MCQLLDTKPRRSVEGFILRNLCYRFPSTEVAVDQVYVLYPFMTPGWEGGAWKLFLIGYVRSLPFTFNITLHELKQVIVISKKFIGVTKT